MTKLKKFSWDEVEMEKFQFIAHLLDRVLIGENGDESFEQLREAVEQDAVWEVHFFNTRQEIFAAREGEELVVYQSLMHREDCPERMVARIYKLDESFTSKFTYKTLEVREYLDFDDDGLAYVARTVLYKLEGGPTKDDR
ncbi:hypothetical protein SK3146_04725 [Paenibacillus konkukensis]|uniref:Uncharacterized protein n=1 Tax=Paenibacillus konkukensis TaxID=2020716 RepID=A0ABY4RUX4_9BACL|nr:hypothetical protein [Paenibacillus konkukensis]UQZ85436.1 hypothetical protein SK3146_04725 [Paenibacillus konkukensis]